MTAREEAVLRLHRATNRMNATRQEWERAVVAARNEGIPVRNIAEVAGVSPQTVLNVVARFNASGG